LNYYANLREYLIHFTTDLLITDQNSIKFQASIIAQLTQIPNQLTRLTSVKITFFFFIVVFYYRKMIATDQCYGLASALNSISTKIPYEDLQTSVALIAQCTSNIMTVRFILL
jgi:hypothetical protein